jgi:putative MATE family efflux protein
MTMASASVTAGELQADPAGTPAPEKPRYDPRTRTLIEGPIAATLVRLAAPNMLVMLAQTSVGLIETYFVGELGTDALAGVALVFPVVMLMQMMSAGAMGGGISSAIARALGGGRRADADALALHALVIAMVFGLAFTIALIAGGRALYTLMGGSGGSLDAAMTYSTVVFVGAILVWLFNSLANVIRGTGNMMVPATVTCAGVIVLIPLSPCLIFGLGPFPRLGVAGGAVAVVLYYAVGSLVLAAYLRSSRGIVRLRFAGIRLRWPLFADILRVGLVAALITVQTNLTIAIATGLVGAFGPAAIAGYGTGSRLEYLLIPLVFGLGGPLVAMVGTNIGAGRRDRGGHLRDHWPRRSRSSLRVAVAVRQRPRDDRCRIALPARRRSGLRPVRSRHGALFRFARRWTPVVAAAGELCAASDRCGWRLAGLALDRQPHRYFHCARRGACSFRVDQCRGCR